MSNKRGAEETLSGDLVDRILPEAHWHKIVSGGKHEKNLKIYGGVASFFQTICFFFSVFDNFFL